MTNASEERARVEARKVIEHALDGKADLLAVCRTLVGLRHELPDPDNEAMLTVVAVASELDDIPGPAEYSRWNRRALEEKLTEKDEYLRRARPSLEAALRSLSDALRG